jgi:hypothetical protein
MLVAIFRVGGEEEERLHYLENLEDPGYSKSRGSDCTMVKVKW